MDGKGVLTKGQTSKFVGNFKQNMKQGPGALYTLYGVYQGEFADGLMSGQGKFSWKDGKVYIG